MNKKVKKIGILTSGGDAPGMNAIIRAIVRTAIKNGISVKGVLKGFNGLLVNELIDLNSNDVSDIIHRGGTILYTDRSEEYRTLDGQKKALQTCIDNQIDSLIVIGGDGSINGAKKLVDLGINVIGIPGTIDLDVSFTEYTIGFDTAVNTAMNAIDKIKDTSTSHERCSIIEVMGRKSGHIALWSGIANGAEDILIPGIQNIDEEELVKKISESRQGGKKHYIVINAEGVGDSENLAKRISKLTGMDTRATVLGHLQRGGSPTMKDRVMGSMMGSYAVDLLVNGEENKLVAVKDGRLSNYNFDEISKMHKDVDKYMYRIQSIIAT